MSNDAYASWEQRRLEPLAHGRYCYACGFQIWHDEGERCPCEWEDLEEREAREECGNDD